jgi:hypothetical protein
MSKSQIIEQLAAAIAEEIYIDIAKWHLYLNDAHLHIPLAEQFYLLMSDRTPINQKLVTDVLTGIKIKVGGGQREIPLSNLIPKTAQFRLLDILEQFDKA